MDPQSLSSLLKVYLHVDALQNDVGRQALISCVLMIDFLPPGITRYTELLIINTTRLTALLHYHVKLEPLNTFLKCHPSRMGSTNYLHE